MRQCHVKKELWTDAGAACFIVVRCALRVMRGGTRCARHELRQCGPSPGRGATASAQRSDAMAAPAGATNKVEKQSYRHNRRRVQHCGPCGTAARTFSYAAMAAVGKADWGPRDSLTETASTLRRRRGCQSSRDGQSPSGTSSGGSADRASSLGEKAHCKPLAATHRQSSESIVSRYGTLDDFQHYRMRYHLPSA